jgi:hypothetical protein
MDSYFLINNWTSLMIILMSHMTFKHEFSKIKCEDVKHYYMYCQTYMTRKIIVHLDVEPC